MLRRYPTLIVTALLSAIVQLWSPSMVWAQPPPVAPPVAPPEAPTQSDANKASARALFFEGHDAFKAEEWGRAEALFERSNRLFPAPTALLWQARAQTKLGRLVEAHERYREVLARALTEDASTGFREAVAQARAEAAALRPRLAGIVLNIGAATTQVTVRIDGVHVPNAALGANRVMDPGEHRIAATAPGYLERVEQLTLKEGEALRLTLTLAEAPGDEAKRLRGGEIPALMANDAASGDGTLILAGGIVTGLGGAAFIVAIVSGVHYLHSSATIDEQCNEALECSVAGLSAVDSVRTVAVVNTIAIVSGATLASAGVVMLVMGSAADADEDDAAPKASARVAPYAGPDGAGLVFTGTF